MAASTSSSGRGPKSHISGDPSNVGSRQLQELVEKLSRGRTHKKTQIVLVPGFSAWDLPLFGTFNYWGGFIDIAGNLNKRGYPVLLVKPGPISSNWERACEIYAQLESGQWEHDPLLSPLAMGTITQRRMATTKTGIANVLLNILASHGGNTIRYLIHLLKEGSEYSDYFEQKDRDDMVKSVVTIGTPHRGTTVIDVLKKCRPPDWKAMLKQLVASTSFLPPDQRFYDLQLDHWGFMKREDEGFQEMFERLGRAESPHGKCPIENWCESNHHGFYDNSIEGVRALNLMAPVPSPRVFYFTMSFKSTTQLPIPTVNADDLKTFPFTPILKAFVDFFNIKFGINDDLIRTITRLMAEEPRLPVWLTSLVNRNLRDLHYDIELPQPGSVAPRPDVLLPMAATCYAMGGYNLEEVERDILMDFTEGRYVRNEDWHDNDGIVNTSSMPGPDDRFIRDIKNFPTEDISQARGLYWDLGTNVTMDHAVEIGVYVEDGTVHGTDGLSRWQSEEVAQMYNNLADLLSLL